MQMCRHDPNGQLVYYLCMNVCSESIISTLSEYGCVSYLVLNNLRKIMTTT